jgi:ribosome biogenesis protein Tsr3
VSPADRPIMLQHGIATVDCSWAQVESMEFNQIRSPHERLRMGKILIVRPPSPQICE